MVSPSSLSGRSEANELKLPDQSSHIRAMMILLSALSIIFPVLVFFFFFFFFGAMIMIRSMSVDQTLMS
ncbi:unnamed protein product, partial [Arabidopsis halleri]